MDVRIDRSTCHRTSQRAKDHMEVAWVRIWMVLRLRSLVSELDEPDRPRLTDDRTADLLAYLARQGIKDGLRSLSMSTRQDVWTVLFEHEDRPVKPGEDRSRGHNELKRRLLIGEKAREEEPGHSPDDISGGNRGQVVYFGQ
jgi:hypothetical protein